MQSYADRDNSKDKEDKDFQSKISAGYELDKKRASQKMDQDNFCYRDDDNCQQANEGQQIVGKDIDAKGFNDQSRNLQSTTATAGAAGGTGNNGNGNTPTPPTTGTLNVCKKIGNQSSDFTFEPSDFAFTFTSGNAFPAEFAGSADCTKVTVPEGQYSFKETGHLPDGFSIFPVATGDCTQDFLFGQTFRGSIKVGETQTCTVTNHINPNG